MCNVCKCNERPTAPGVASTSWDDITALSAANTSAFAARNIKIDVPGVSVASALHTTTDGGLFLTTSSVTNLQGDVTLSGGLGAFPVQLHLSLSIQGDTVTVTLEVQKPIPLGPFTWTFKLGGVTKDARGNITGAQSIAISPDMPAFAAAGFGSHVICILKCAGLAILPILVGCLPSLTGGPQGFIACVVAKAGTGAASIATCVANCIAG